MTGLGVIKRFFVLIWVSGFMSGFSADPTHAQEKPAASDADFSSKVVAISIKGPEGAGAVLEKVQLRRLGNRAFLVGQTVNMREGPEPFAGLTTWIAVDEVVQIREFKDRADARKRYQIKPEPTVQPEPYIPGP